jgi:arginase family enzyme
VEGPVTPAHRDDERRLVALLPRTSDIETAGMLGARAVGEKLGARLVGSPGEGRRADYEEDLRESRGVLLEAGGQIDDAFEDGRAPILLAGTCSVAISTLPVVVRHNPDAWVLWLDAHGDFNTPETTRSRFLGGMCLSAACGLWDAGFGAGLDPSRVVMFGVRDVDGPEQVLLTRAGVGTIDRPSDLADALDGRPVFVHLDLDVLDPDALPASFPADGGLTFDQLHRTLDLVAGAADVIGAEIAGAHPDYAEDIAAALAPLL